MASHSAELEKLAQVFMAGFRFGSDPTAEEVRKMIDSEFSMLQKSLPEGDATEFANLVEEIIIAMTSSINVPDSNTK